MISMVTLTKGLKHVGLSADFGFGSNFANALVLSAGVGLTVALVGGVLLSRLKPSGKDENSIENVERVFGILMIFTACAMAFAHGSNDVANAVGPLAAVVSTVQSGGAVGATSVMPLVGLGCWRGGDCVRSLHLWLASDSNYWA